MLSKDLLTKMEKARWSVAMQFAPGSAGVISSSGVAVEYIIMELFYLLKTNLSKSTYNFCLLEPFVGYYLRFLRLYFEAPYHKKTMPATCSHIT